MNRRQVRRPGMSALQAVLLIGGAFVVVWGLMAVWQATQQPLQDQAIKTLRGEPGNTGPGAGGGNGAPTLGGGGSQPVVGPQKPNPTNPSTGEEPGETMGEFIEAAVKGIEKGYEEYIEEAIKSGKVPESAFEGLRAGAAWVKKAARTFDIVAYLATAFKAVEKKDDRAIIVGAFKTVGGFIGQDVLGPLIGGAIGSVAPGVGTVAVGTAGAVAGGVLGAKGGEILGNVVVDVAEWSVRQIAAGVHWVRS